jgi:hypothetical protein
LRIHRGLRADSCANRDKNERFAKLFSDLTAAGEICLFFTTKLANRRSLPILLQKNIKNAAKSGLFRRKSRYGLTYK